MATRTAKVVTFSILLVLNGVFIGLGIPVIGSPLLGDSTEYSAVSISKMRAPHPETEINLSSLSTTNRSIITSGFPSDGEQRNIVFENSTVPQQLRQDVYVSYTSSATGTTGAVQKERQYELTYIHGTGYKYQSTPVLILSFAVPWLSTYLLAFLTLTVLGIYIYNNGPIHVLGETLSEIEIGLGNVCVFIGVVLIGMLVLLGGESILPPPARLTDPLILFSIGATTFLYTLAVVVLLNDFYQQSSPMALTAEEVSEKEWD